MAENDPILPPSDPAPDNAPIQPRRREPIVCEFCECRLTPSGDVLKKSDKARAIDRQSEKIEDLESKLAGAVSDVHDANAKIAELEGNRKKPFSIPI
jgi:hypothetical protein